VLRTGGVDQVLKVLPGGEHVINLLALEGVELSHARHRDSARPATTPTAYDRVIGSCATSSPYSNDAHHGHR
jgi:hypothetical protein